MISIEQTLLGVAVLLLLSVFGSKASARLGVPALLLFLAIGMMAGSDGPGGIHFDAPELAQSLGIVALILILFSGGLDSEWKFIRPVLWQGFSLSTLGVLFSALLVGAFAKFCLGFSWPEGFLLGAIVSSTDAAAVFSILRSKSVGLKPPLRPLLEFESGSNDPMAVFLTMGIILFFTEKSVSPFSIVILFFRQMIVGAALGYVFGKLMVVLFNKIKLEYEGLYPVLSIALVLLLYGVSSSLGGNGFLSVYFSGLVLGSAPFIHKKSLIRFHDGLAWLMQITMFLALGLLVFPSQLIDVIGIGLLASVFLIFVARPLSIFLSLAFFKIGFREKIMVSWVGLRGAVPIILATFPLVAKIPKAELFFNLVFFIVLSSSLFQGGSIPWVARLLKLDEPFEKKRRYPIEYEQLAGVDTNLIEFIVPYHSEIIGKKIVDLHMPEHSLIALICRDENFVVPSGTTTLQDGDVILALVNKHNAQDVGRIFSRK